MAERIKLQDFDEKVLNNPLPVLVDFYSDSCVPCKRLAPVIGTVEDEKAGELAVFKVNINFDAVSFQASCPVWGIKSRGVYGLQMPQKSMK